MKRGQVALEYLVIITIAITITAVVALLAINFFGTQQNQYYYNSCRQAASTCDITRSASPSDECSACDDACRFSDGTELFADAIKCCKAGLPERIYEGSTECSGACASSADCGGAPCCEGTCCSSDQVCSGGTCITPTGCTGDAQCVAQLNPTFCERARCVITNFNGVCVKEPDPSKLGVSCPPGTVYDAYDRCQGTSRCRTVHTYTCTASGTCQDTPSVQCTNCVVASSCFNVCSNGQCDIVPGCGIGDLNKPCGASGCKCCADNPSQPLGQTHCAKACIE